MPQGFTLLYSPPPATHIYSRRPTVEAHDQGNVPSSFPELRSGVAQIPRSGTDPSEGTFPLIIPPERAGGYLVRKPAPPIPV